MPQPELRVTSVTIGSSQPGDLARFYADLLGWRMTASEEGWAQIKPPPDTPGPSLNFEHEQRFRRPVWPARDGEQNATQHLDIHVDELRAAVEWAESRGARLAPFQPQDDVRVMFDPDGHPFCLFL